MDVLPTLLFVYLFLVCEAPVWGVYAAVILSRACSSLYHIFNCVSARMNRSLINLDFIGISCMALVSIHNSYVAVLFALCLCVFGSMLVAGRVSRMSQPLLVLLAVVGGYPLLDNGWCVVAGLGFAVGYALFVLHTPERYMREGAADGKIYNSHVLWHIMASLAQLALLQSTST